MRTQILKGIAAASILGAMLGLSASVMAADVRATVPFSFTVSKKVLPPGTYTIGSSGSSTLMISSFGGSALTLSQRMESHTAQSPKLVFHRYGEEYILREVWTGGGVGRKLPESRRERELANARTGASTASVARVEIPIL